MSTTTTVTASQTPEQFGDSLAKALENPTGPLLKLVQVVDANGKQTGETKPRFVLSPESYIDIKLYLAAGMHFPETLDVFHRLYPRGSFARVDEIDPTIYDETVIAMTSVHKSCKEFNDNALPQFRNITAEVKKYAANAIAEIQGIQEGSFLWLLDILTDPKYSADGSEDTVEFRGAREAASEILLNLSKEAQKKAAKVETCSDTITSFLTVLDADKTRTDKVVAKWSGDNGISNKLHKDLENLRQEIKNAAKAAQDADADYKHNKSVADSAVAYIWIPFAGWVAGTTVILVHNARAAEAYAKYNAQLKIESEKNEELGRRVRLSGSVDELTAQNEKMADLMVKAKQALTDIRSAFTQLNQDLGLASSMMGAADGQLRRGLWARQTMVKKRVNEAVKSWENAIAACDDLLNADAKPIKTEGLTPDATPPEVK